MSALFDLVAKGSQDLYLVNKPEMSHFTSTYKQYTNFSKISKNLNFQNDADFGTCGNCKIKKHGDLLGRIYLKIVFPKLEEADINTTNAKTNLYIRWCESPGISIINCISIKIGGQLIDKQDKRFMQIWSDITDDAAIKDCLIGNKTYMIEPLKTQPETICYIPLKFWFCENTSQHLPLIALQYHEVEIDVEFEKFHKMYQILEKSGTNYNYTNYKLKSKNLVNTCLTCNYIYLDTKERKKFAQSSHEYLIQQLQINNYPIQGNTSIPLTFNHPVKELMWLLQSDSVLQVNELLNFSGQKKYIANSLPSNLKYNQFLRPHLLDKAKLTLNGQDRTDWHDYNYFYYVQNYESFRNCAEHFAYIYSFSLNPWNLLQPSGSLNFSRIDNASLSIKVNKDKVNTLNPAIIYIYAVNYNVLRIQSGMGGLKFAN